MRIRRLLASAALVASLVPAAGFAQEDVPQRASFLKAEVLQVLSQTVDEDSAAGSRTVQSLRMEEVGGADDGNQFVFEYATLGSREEGLLKQGDRLVLEKVINADGTVKYLFRDRYRFSALLVLFGAFLVLAFVLGGRTSLMSVGGLLVSVGILLYVVIPGIIRGWDPLITCLAGCGAIALTSLYLAHGFTRRTSVALLSTMLTLGIATGMAVLFVRMAKLFGMGSEESMFIQLSQLQDVDMRGLLLGGILIGCLGVLDDITTAQTAAVDEISKANPSLTSAQLRKAGFSVGKEHIASLINTLALAYVGASLPLLLLVQTQSDYPLWVTLNGEFIAEEIVRTLVGSATLLFAVPISTWCAAALVKAKPGDAPRGPRGHAPSHHHHHHA